MTPKPISELLEEIRKRADAATAGPWVAGDGFVSTEDDCVCQFWSKDEMDFNNPVSNARFIAHARTDVPRLLEALECMLEGLDFIGSAAAHHTMERAQVILSKP